MINKNKIILITGATGQDGILLSKIFLKKSYSIFGIIKKKNKHQLKNVNYVVNNLKNYKNV